MVAPADSLLLRNARRYGGGAPEDIWVRGGRIAAVGPASTVETTADVTPVDLAGRFVGPGLWDNHVHFTQWVVRRRRFDVSATASAADAVARVQAEVAAAARAPDGRPLVGYGFRDGLWPDTPTVAGLDAVAPDVPVVLLSADLHCGWLNSRAAALVGMDVDASGILSEDPWFEARRRLGEERALTVADYRDAAVAAAARGVVGIVEFENADNPSLWPDRAAAGVDMLRVEASVRPHHLAATISRGLRTGDVLDERGLITMGRLKVVVDGSLNTRTALCWDPYPGLPADHPHPCGIGSVSPPQLRELLEMATPAGIAAAVHAIGDRANTEVLDVFEAVGVGGVIEHAQLMRADDFARFAGLGLEASVQPEHAMDDRDVADRYWAGRTERAFAFASLHAAGVSLQMGSDAPVAPLDPWQAISAATTRQRDGRDAWHPEQRLPLDVVLAASSRGCTTVAVGSPADLVVLDADPYATADLRSMSVAATLLAGAFTFDAIH